MGLVIGCYGEKGNFLESLAAVTGGATGLAGGVPVIVTSEDANYLRANLFDGLVCNPFRFNAIAADCQITVDLNLVQNAGAELNAMTGWTLVGATPTTSTTPAGREGTYAFRITANNEAFYQVRYLRAGSVYRFQAAAFGGGGAVSANVTVTDLRNGRQLDNAGAWQASASFIARTTASFATTGPVSFTVPAFGTSRYDLVPVQITCSQTGGAGTVYFDSLYLWPAWDFVSVHGHNIQPNLSVELRRDTAAFAGAGTQIGSALVAYRPSFYSSFAQVTDRYLRLKLTGTVGAGQAGAAAAIGPTYIGELVVSQKLAAAAYPSFGYETGHNWAISRPTSGRSFIIDDDQHRRIDLSFRYRNTVEFTEARDFILRGAIGGFPLVLVPDDADPAEPELVMYGFFEAREWARQRTFLHVRDATLTFLEQAFPTFVA